MENIKALFQTTVSCRVTIDQKQKIEKLSSQLKMTKSEYVRNLLINTLNNLS